MNPIVARDGHLDRDLSLSTVSKEVRSSVLEGASIKPMTVPEFVFLPISNMDDSACLKEILRELVRRERQSFPRSVRERRLLPKPSKA